MAAKQRTQKNEQRSSRSGRGGSERLELLAEALERSYASRGWHGPTLGGALSRVPAEIARWRPPGPLHSVWELALHAAYWKYAVRRRLLLAEGESEDRHFPRAPANFPSPPEPPPEGPGSPEDRRLWASDRRLLKREHGLLVETVRGFDPARLGEIAVRGKGWTYEQMILGVAAHDAYHTGQVRLLVRLADLH